MGKTLSRFAPAWKWLGHISQAWWVATALVTAVTTLAAYLDGQPWWVLIIAALGALATVAILWAGIEGALEIGARKRASQAKVTQEKRARVDHAPPSSAFDMSLSEVVKMVAYDSEWAASLDITSPGNVHLEAEWGARLGEELLRKLADEETGLIARGIKRSKAGQEHGRDEIPASFWRNPKLEMDADRLLAEPGFDFVMNFGEGITYHDIVLRSVDVKRVWPARRREDIESAPSPFVAWAKDWRAEYDDRLINVKMEMEETRARLLANARRKLISDGRDLAHEYTNGNQDETFREFLEAQRAYADIRPYLSAEYLAKLERQRMAYADARGAKYPTLVQWFLDDLALLEKEWRLL